MILRAWQLICVWEGQSQRYRDEFLEEFESASLRLVLSFFFACLRIRIQVGCWQAGKSDRGWKRKY